VLYVEDNEVLARLTTHQLQPHAIEVHVVPTGELAIAEISRLRPELVLLDVELPGLDGFAVCRRLRTRTSVPIIMVTAAATTGDRVRGLEEGADDFVTTPFELRELVARIRAQVRRARGELGPRRDRVEVGELVVDPAAHLAMLRGTTLALTSMELALLHVLASHAGNVLDREQLVEALHGSADSAFDRSIDVLVSRLRGKLGDDPKQPRLLKTVRRVGYVLTARVEPARRPWTTDSREENVTGRAPSRTGSP
jgi:DNA-binding response OmpR family regulator